MSGRKPFKTQEEMKNAILLEAALLFIKKGYTDTTLKNIAANADVNIGSLMNIFKAKDEILCEMVKQMLEGQFSKTAALLNGITDDKILFYAAETALQLHITEMNENLRDLYMAAYSLPSCYNVIQYEITGKLERIFGEHLPNLKTKDFYKLEIASGGVMRGFMAIPCNMWFTMDQKIASFIEATFLIYRVSDEKIQEAINFVSQFDFPAIAEQTVNSFIDILNVKSNERNNVQNSAHAFV